MPSEKDLEAREWSVASIDVVEEERAGGKVVKVAGHAAVFNQLSQDLGGFREQISPGAFADALAGADIRLLINHADLPIARTTSGTLKLREDAQGLAIEGELDPSDPDVQRLLPKMRRGDVRHMSFAFRVAPGGQDWARNEDGVLIRTLKKVRLSEVSIVGNPAYLGTDVAVRSMTEWTAQNARTESAAESRANLIAARNREASITL